MRGPRDACPLNIRRHCAEVQADDRTRPYRYPANGPILNGYAMSGAGRAVSSRGVTNAPAVCRLSHAIARGHACLQRQVRRRFRAARRRTGRAPEEEIQSFAQLARKRQPVQPCYVVARAVTRTTTEPDAVVQEKYRTGLGQRLWLPRASIDAGFTGMREEPVARGSTTLIATGELPVGQILSGTKFDDKASRQISRKADTSDCTGSRQGLASRPGAVRIAVVILFKVADIECKHTADFARELLHDRKTFRAFWGKVFRIPLSLCPSDCTDTGLKRPCLRPDGIVFGRVWLLMRHACIFGRRGTNFNGLVRDIQGNITNGRKLLTPLIQSD
ncbi:hypothetical protein C7401_12262 [Paraburkholderia unamae]|nr:hypothetical protein C7401_12262 [Paraburkholderia unamae]